LPIGAYTYSQGLESSIEEGVVHDKHSAREWISESLLIVSDFESPILWRLMQAFSKQDMEAANYWTDCLIAARDTAEFRAETIQMGYSLGKLITDLGIVKEPLRSFLTSRLELPLPAAYVCAAEALAIPHEDALLGMLFALAENLVIVCVKSIPIGQVSGQELLFSLHAVIEIAAQRAQQLQDDELSSWAPGLSILSMRHETQYSRIYRS